MTGSAAPPPASPAAPPKQVIIIGAGVSGLSCAHHLLNSPLNVNVVVLEARHRIGGRIFTHWLSATDQDAPLTNANEPAAPASDQSSQPASAPSSGPVCHSFQALSSGQVNPPRLNPNGTPRLSVDVGASILHGCGDDNQLVFRRAIEDRIRAPIVAGGGFYESTEHALWFDDETGHRLSSDAIVEAHHIFFMASRYTASVASCCDDGAATLESVFTCGVNYVREHLPPCALVCPSIQSTLLKKIAARSMGYCAPMSNMALMQASAGMEVTGVDAIIGVPHEEDDPPFPGEVPTISPSAIRQQALKYDRSIIASQHPQRHTIASRRGGPGDRIVLDGYTPFLIDRLAHGVDVRLGQSVCAISKGFRAPPNPTAAPPPADPPEAKDPAPSGSSAATTTANGKGSVPAGGSEGGADTAAATNTTKEAQPTSAESETPTPSSPSRSRKRERSVGALDEKADEVNTGGTGQEKSQNKMGSSGNADKSFVDKNSGCANNPMTNSVTNNCATNGNDPSCLSSSTSSWDSDPEVQTRTILVSTRGGEIFHGDIVVVTAPLGVLQGNDEQSRISFSPSLSENKVEAIHGMGMGVHNKIVLRFNEADVFWPPHVPQLNCLDERFQMFNLHAYGKKGVLLVHVFAESGFANGYGQLSDSAVLVEVMVTLAGMFCPKENEADFDGGEEDGDEDDDDKDEVVEEDLTVDKPTDDGNPALIEEEKEQQMKDVTDDAQKAQRREKKRLQKSLRKEAMRSKMMKARATKKELARKRLGEMLKIHPGCNQAPNDEKNKSENQSAKPNASESKVECNSGMEVDSEKDKLDQTELKKEEDSKPDADKKETVEEKGTSVMKDERKIDKSKTSSDIGLGDGSATEMAKTENVKVVQSGQSGEPKTSAVKQNDNKPKQTRSATAGGGTANEHEGITNGPRRMDWNNIPLPEEYVVTRWDEDPYALGSYSFMPCGSNWTVIDEMATPEPRESAHPYLFFAGEHCSDLGWQCVHGAYETGMRAAQDIVKCVGGDAMVARAFGSATVNHPGLNNADVDAKGDENVNMMNMQLENDPNLNINFINMNVNVDQQGIPLATAGFDSIGMGIAVDPNAAAAAAAASGVAHQYYQNVTHPTGVINADPSSVAGHPVAMDIEQVHAQQQQDAVQQQQGHIGAMPHAANVHIAHLQQQHGQIPVQLAQSMNIAEQVPVAVAGISGVVPGANPTATAMGVGGGTTEDFMQQARQDQQELLQQQQVAQFQFQQQHLNNGAVVMPGGVGLTDAGIAGIKRRSDVSTAGAVQGSTAVATVATSVNNVGGKSKSRGSRGSGRGSSSNAAGSGQMAQSNGENKNGEGFGVLKDEFWTTERERALTRALIGYSDVYGNVDDVIDEIAYALQTFKKEATDLGRADIIQLVRKRIGQRVVQGDTEAKAFVKFHKPGREALFLSTESGNGNGLLQFEEGDGNDAEDGENDRSERFAQPFEAMNGRARLIGLNGSKLKEMYAGDIVDALKKYARPVADNQISFRETLRKIAVMIYRKDGGLMTKRCLSEYLRTQEFGTGPQKELYLEKYIPGGAAAYTNNHTVTNTK